MFGAEVTDDGKKLLITVSKDCDPVNQLYYADLDKVDISKLNGDLPVTKLIDNFEAQYEYITNEGSIVWFKTNLDAPRYKVITIDLANPARENWKEIIAQDEKDVLSYAICVNTDKLLLVHLHDVAVRYFVLVFYSLSID
jgi:prolyl oligopeptidase